MKASYRFRNILFIEDVSRAVKGFRFEGIESANPAPGIIDAIKEADAIVICPSNPWVSIAPILAVPHPSHLARHGRGLKKICAVSPIIGGQAVKGPAAKMYRELGIEPSALAVAKHYQNLITGFVFDEVDAKSRSRYSRLKHADIDYKNVNGKLR